MYKVLLDFLHFAKFFAQNIIKSCKREWSSTKGMVLFTKNTGVNQTCMHAWLHGDHSAATMKLIYLLDTDNLQCSFNYYFNVRFCATT